jgi:hypothetical protein
MLWESDALLKWKFTLVEPFEYVAQLIEPVSPTTIPPSAGSWVLNGHVVLPTVMDVGVTAVIVPVAFAELTTVGATRGAEAVWGLPVPDLIIGRGVVGSTILVKTPRRQVIRALLPMTYPSAIGETRLTAQVTDRPSRTVIAEERSIEIVPENVRFRGVLVAAAA